MPSILDLLNNLPNFNYYYGGYGNFTQKSLSYGNDQPGGGSSDQPFIKRKIGEKWSPTSIDDGVMPLGIIGATERSVTDVERITKFFATTQGIIFLSKQTGLQLSNVKSEQKFQQKGIETTGNIFSDTVSLPSRISKNIGTTRVYNLGLNTLAQVGVSAFGGHFYRHGLSPIMNDDDKYLNIVSANNQINNDKVSSQSGNRLLRLESSLFDSTNFTIDNYSGGPGSVYGIGTTTINRNVHTIGDADQNQNSGNNNFIPIKISDLARISRDGILIQKTPVQLSSNQPTVTSLTPQGSINPGNDTLSYDMKSVDFRMVKNALYGINLPQTDYIKYNLSTRIGRGNPGTPKLNRSKYWVPLVGTQDAINKLSLFYSSGPPQTDSGIVDLNSGEIVTAASVRDLIKFRIESIDNDNPSSAIWIVFRALINGFSDSFNADWNTYKYTGRGEKFYVYDGFVRQIGLGFTIAAQSRQEMKPLYQKLNYLMSNMAPDYNVANKMRGNLIRLTLGDYMYRQPGIINEMHIDTESDYPWEIAIAEPEGGNDDNTMHEVPMILKVSFTFIPIHDFLPRKSASAPFISIRDRKSPSDPIKTPAANDWLSDDGYTKNNQDGTKKYIPLDQKISAARKAVTK